MSKTLLIGSYLYGYIPGKERVLIKNTTEQIAAFIMANRLEDELKITNFLGMLEIQTEGEFIGFCANRHFLQNQLLPTLEPMQKGEAEVIEFKPYVNEDLTYKLKNVRGFNQDGKYVLLDLDFLIGVQETLVNDEVFDTEDQLIEKYPNSISLDFAKWYIHATSSSREELAEEYAEDYYDNKSAKELLGVSDEVLAKLMAEGEHFLKAVTEKVTTMTCEELNAWAFKHDILIRVDE